MWCVTRNRTQKRAGWLYRHLRQGIRCCSLILIAISAITPAGLSHSQSSGSALLIKDINIDGAPLTFGLGEIAAIGERLFFTTQGVDGKLWESDGTAAGTLPLHDSGEIGNLTNVSGTLFFTVLKSRGPEMWKSDGTITGTLRVRAFPSGSGLEIWRLQALTDVHGTLYFTTMGGVENERFTLWKSDGTAEGTVLVKDFSTRRLGSIESLTNVNGLLFFVVRPYIDPCCNTGWELWRSDGAAEGTSPVKEIASCPGPGGNDRWHLLTPFQGMLFFVPCGGGLWKTDGTSEGTLPVSDLGGFGGGSLTSVQGTLFFVAYTESSGSELWKSDGSTEGTVLVKDISPGAGRAFADEPSILIDINGRLFFRAIGSGGGTEESELWISDGTAEGTTLVKRFSVSPEHRSIAELTNLNGTLFFIAYSESGWDLWKSDGSTTGTAMVKNLPAESDTLIQVARSAGGELFFFVGSFEASVTLWKSNGLSTGTVPVITVRPPGSSMPSALTNVNGTLFFMADDGTHGSELWKSNGTAIGTMQVKDINPGIEGSDVGSMVRMQGTLFMLLSSGLWKSDGTADGTVLVKSVTYPLGLINADGRLYFIGGDTHDQLWTSDGTTLGTVLLKSFGNPDYRCAYLSQLTNVNGELFFAAGCGLGALWKSNGTAAGTVMVKQLEGQASSLTNLNGTLFFIDQYTKLWESDGTVAGTSFIKDISSTGVTSYVNWLTSANGHLFFEVMAELGDSTLWISDGTAGGTVPIKAFHKGEVGSPTSLNGALFFVAVYNNGVCELWKSSGTVASTMKVKELSPASPELSPSFFSLTNVDGTLLFTVDDDIHGAEPWKSDGTTAGTVMLQDIAPGGLSSHPKEYTVAGSLVFFRAKDSSTGTELWAMPRDGLKSYHVNLPIFVK
jgi:ELWxxDGT repeat protein